MENPNTWGPAQKVIFEAMQAYEKDVNDGVCGHSLTTVIFNRLVDAGFLSPNNTTTKK